MRTSNATAVADPASCRVPAAALDAALAGARREGSRLFALQRGMLASAAVGAAAVALRGIAAVAWPAGRGSFGLGIALVVALVACGAVFTLGLRARGRMERLARDVQALELARDALDHDAAPRVEIHPYRAREGDERPLVVVRTDDVRRLLLEGDAAGAPPVSWFARAAAGVVVVLVVVLGASVFVGGATSARHRWTFLGEASSPDTLGFRIGAPRGGPWSVEHDQAATGARSLVNRIGEEDAPPALLVASVLRARDVRAVTRCRVSRDREGGACGIVFRYVDDGTHHVARLESGSGRVVLARVAGGSERVLGSSAGQVLAGVWHELAVDARGDALTVSWNGETVIDLHDVRPAPAGAVGLWAPPGSEAYFDELAVDVLPTAPQAVEILPLLQKRTSLASPRDGESDSESESEG